MKETEKVILEMEGGPSMVCVMKEKDLKCKEEMWMCSLGTLLCVLKFKKLIVFTQQGELWVKQRR